MHVHTFKTGEQKALFLSTGLRTAATLAGYRVEGKDSDLFAFGAGMVSGLTRWLIHELGARAAYELLQERADAIVPMITGMEGVNPSQGGPACRPSQTR